jgi:hypothetical protein
MIRIMHMSDGTVRTTKMPPWAAALGGIAAVAMGLVVLAVGVGIALVLAPIAIGGVLYARYRLKKIVREAQERFAAQQAARHDYERAQAGGFDDKPPAQVIDVEYRVIDEPRRP